MRTITENSDDDDDDDDKNNDDSYDVVRSSEGNHNTRTPTHGIHTAFTYTQVGISI
jgi:hypothetical protein